MVTTRDRPAAAGAPRSFWRSPIFAALMLAAATALAYHRTFAVPFVFDDELSIPANPTIRSLWQAWLPPGGGITVSGRPLLNFTFAVNFALSGTDVWSYHAVNLLIHIAAGVTLYGVVRRTFLQPALAPRFGSRAGEIALVAAALWTLHPLQTESVTYVVQRAESLMGFFYLLTLWCFIRAAETGAAKKWGAFTVIAAALGMASKEVMVSAPLLITLYDRIFIAGNWRAVWTQRRNLHLVLASTWLLLLLLVLSDWDKGGSTGFGLQIKVLDYALTQAWAVVHYLRLVVWPSPLILDYGGTLVNGWSEVAWQLPLILVLVGASMVAAWRGGALGFCGILFFAVLAPTSSFMPLRQTIAEHRMYLPLAPVVVIIVAALYRWLGQKILIALAVVAVALGIGTAQRNHDYATAIGLYEDTVTKRPENARAMALLGDYYRRAGRFDEARAMLERSLTIEPGIPEVLNNLGNVWLDLARPEQAVPYFEQAHAAAPQRISFLNNLGNALILAGRVPEGLIQLEAALRAAPRSTETRRNLANALAQSGRLADAAVQFETLLAQQPADGAARYDYSKVLQDLGRGNDALRELETAVRLEPASADAHNHFGIGLARIGRMREALAEFQAALALDPTHVSAQQNAALAQRRLGYR